MTRESLEKKNKPGKLQRLLGSLLQKSGDAKKLIRDHISNLVVSERTSTTELVHEKKFFEDLDCHIKARIERFLFLEFWKKQKSNFPGASENLLMLLCNNKGNEEDVLKLWIRKDVNIKADLKELKDGNWPAYEAFQKFMQDFRNTKIQLVRQGEEIKILKFRAFEQYFELGI